jgi:hypothetical protein
MLYDYRCETCNIMLPRGCLARRNLRDGRKCKFYNPGSTMKIRVIRSKEDVSKFPARGCLHD